VTRAAGGVETMTRKSYSQNGKKCRVTFELPAEVSARTVALAGDFNDWKPAPLTQRKDGRFSLTVSLNGGTSYRYRYLIDDTRWENDWAADGYVPNEYGSDDSVVVC
jgi:1,4-alpha-glucan branching enzyme